MIAPPARQVDLFHSPLDKQVSLIKDDLLDPIDKLLDDPELLALVRDKLSRRSPQSTRTGRRSIAPDRLLRCCVLKHVKAWSFRQLEREVRTNLVYRRFTRFDADLTPDHVTYSRNFTALGGDVMEAIDRLVVNKAQDQAVAPGRKLRTDTTVVESNIHHPTDSGLLADGVRVLTRLIRRVADGCKPGAVTVVNHGRAVRNRLIEIIRASKSTAASAKGRMTDSYRKLVKLTEAVVSQAADLCKRLHDGGLEVVADAELAVEGAVKRLDEFLPLVRRVLHQTKERVFEGNHHVANKLLSLFETHTQVIRKGKLSKPVEFGRLVRIDEVEGGIVSRAEVLEGNAADTNSWKGALVNHRKTFGHAPRMATADRGFFSARNERQARAMGVKKVVLPARGRLSAKRRKLERERWFRRARRWRSGIEARIATLKHRFAMVRATYKGEAGFKRYVGWTVIGHNLVSLARVLVRRRALAAKDA